MNATGIRRLWALRTSDWTTRPEFTRLPFVVGGPVLTTAFWTIFTAFLIGLWLSPILPFGDYNYHLSLASLLRRMMSSHAVERQLYDTNIISYNSLFHVTVAIVGLVMPVQYAGLLVYSGCWLGLCLSVIALLRALQQPTERAFIVFPVLMGTPFHWGFVNYCTAIVVQLYALARVIRRPRSDVPIRYDVVTGLVAVFGLLSHLFASGVIYTLIFVTLVTRTLADTAPAVVRYLRSLREGFPFLPPVALAYAIYRYQEAGPIKRTDPDGYGDIYALDKLKTFFAWVCDLQADSSDQRRCMYAMAAVVVCAIFRAPPRGERYPALKGWLLITLAVLYLLMPELWWQIAVLMERLPFLIVIFFGLAMPRASVPLEKIVGVALALIGFQNALAFYRLRRAQLPDLRALAQVVDESPPGLRVGAHMPYVELARQRYKWAGHMYPYYVTVKGIESSSTYAKKASMPVRFRGAVPPNAPDGIAQGGVGYDPRAPWASRADLVLVRTLDNDPAPKLWGARANEVSLVSHHGNWWMFDTRRYFGR